ncbi:hypothetical protein NDU88_001346 [Pleurodeles waltl]|uniref:Uncharacterized protein n=1 Tax=Pleurodeles waltl TaxID=8319 RepID=A0AAV7S8Q0_PLEWA|nr:hypothetical protein NDU88_001346 [Pleurodeles waltl]
MCNRLDSYVCKDYRQRLHWKGDCLGRMLAWLLKRERPPPIDSVALRADWGHDTGTDMTELTIVPLAARRGH